MPVITSIGTVYSGDDQFQTIEEIEKEALKRLSKRATSYYQSGGNAMVSLRENKQAFDRIRLKRAAEVDVSKF